MTEPYALRVAAGAACAIQNQLPEAVAGAVVEFITGSLLSNPRRVGKALRFPLEGTYSARRGAFRVLYEIDEDRRIVSVVRVEHRSDVYRPR